MNLFLHWQTVQKEKYCDKIHLSIFLKSKNILAYSKSYYLRA